MSFRPIELSELRFKAKPRRISERPPQPLPKPKKDIFVVSSNSDILKDDRTCIDASQDDPGTSSKENSMLLIAKTASTSGYLKPESHPEVKSKRSGGSIADLAIYKYRRNQLYINDFISDRHKFVNKIYRRTTVEVGDNHVVKFICYTQCFLCGLRILAFMALLVMSLCLIFRQCLSIEDLPKQNSTSTLGENLTGYNDTSTSSTSFSSTAEFPTVTDSENYSVSLSPTPAVPTTITPTSEPQATTPIGPQPQLPPTLESHVPSPTDPRSQFLPPLESQAPPPTEAAMHQLQEPPLPKLSLPPSPRTIDPTIWN